MDFAKVDVQIRESTGKGSARRMRAAGKVPGVLYGRKEEPISLTFDPLALVRSLDKERRRNTVFSLNLGAERGSDITAMIREVQFDPLSRNIVHVDFQRVSLDEDIRVLVPIVLKGTPVGVVNGGNLHHNIHQLPIAAKPADIPLRIEYDVSGLALGQAVHASDLKLPPGVRTLLDPKASLASVVAPRADKADEAAAAAPAAGAEGAAAAPAEGGAAAPAAGGKKEGEKGAAAAPAGKEEKKGK
jgi:large subunit ribosomal protein L25